MCHSLYGQYVTKNESKIWALGTCMFCSTEQCRREQMKSVVVQSSKVFGRGNALWFLCSGNTSPSQLFHL